MTSKTVVSLAPNEAEQLSDTYGTIIRRVSEQVARQYAVSGGVHGHGWEVVPADDIEQAVYEQLIRTGTGTSALDAMDEPQGWLRQTARLYGAANEARKRRRAVLTGFTGQEDDDDDDTDRYGWVSHDPRYASPYGNPEDEADLGGSPLIAAAHSAVLDILGNVASDLQRIAAEHYWLRGLDTETIAAEMGVAVTAVWKALQRARQTVGPEAVASLNAWRAFAHPEVRAAQTNGARPEALLAAINEETP